MKSPLPEQPVLPEIQESITEIQEPLIEEFNKSNNESHLSFNSSSEEDEADLFLFDSIPIGRSHQTNIRLNIIESRESLLKQKDNLVIFIYKNGEPFDNGAKELHEAKLPIQFKNIMYERAQVSSIRNKTLIALPLKFDNRTLIETSNVRNCMQSLLDVITELQLNSFSIRKTDNFDEIP